MSTSAIAVEGRARSARPSAEIVERGKVVLLLLLVACVLRSPHFGNPDYHVDEEFYFLVADRMWHGALPYVDIWDRKPIGLFLIYAALYAFRQSDMLAVQIAGLLFATGTAYTIWRIVRRRLAAGPAILAALLYLFWLPLFGGGNGQSPVFYNFFIALAALLLLRAGDRTTVDGVFVRTGAAGMLLSGLAMQVKYTAGVEAAFFGFYLTAAAWLRGVQPARLIRLALGWALIAFAPTLLAVAYYAAAGELDAFLFANFISIGLRAKLEAHYLDGLIRFIALAGAPLFLTAAAGLLKMGSRSTAGEPGAKRDRIFLLGWTLAALGGFLSIGNFYDHYMLPLLAPLLVLAAYLFESRISAAMLFVFLAAWPTYWAPPPSKATTIRSRSTIQRMAAEIEPLLPYGPMFIYDGPSFLYVAAGAAPPTSFAYPDHLGNIVEQHALGIDTGKEMRAILDRRPAVIVTADKPLIPLFNTVTRPMLSTALARDYVETDRYLESWGNRKYILNVRKDLVRSTMSVRRDADHRSALPIAGH